MSGNIGANPLSAPTMWADMIKLSRKSFASSADNPNGELPSYITGADSWQLYERGELVDVLWGELEWSSPTDDDELPEVTGPAWIVDNVAHYGG